jgi:hypothetical protein
MNFNRGQIMTAISPHAIKNMLGSHIPAWVIDVFKAEIALKIHNGKAIIKQDDIILKVAAAMPAEIAGDMDTESRRRFIFDKQWLDVEAVFRAANWKVVYDKPHYSENYSPYFEFTAKEGVSDSDLNLSCSPHDIVILELEKSKLIASLAAQGLSPAVCAKFSWAFNETIEAVKKANTL